MFYKFPSTPYIETDINITRSDKILSKNEVEDILSKPVTIEEKIDGANLGISFNHNGELRIQNRGSYLLSPLEGQWKPLNNWLHCHEETMFDMLVDNYILFGEWCYAKHSVYYDELPDWFIGFDIFDKKNNRFLSVQQRNHMLDKMKVTVVPQLGYGIYDVYELSQFFQKSKYGSEYCEGIYIRQDEDIYLKYRAKMVRKEFKQNITEHWSRGILKCNKICWR
ncbi:MAG: RNA ligase family protein [Dorea sp.]